MISRFLSPIYSLGEKRTIWLVFWILFNTCLIPTLDAAVWIHFWWNIILVISLDFSSHEVNCIQLSNKKQTWIVPGRDQLKKSLIFVFIWRFELQSSCRQVCKEKEKNVKPTKRKLWHAELKFPQNILFLISTPEVNKWHIFFAN